MSRARMRPSALFAGAILASLIPALSSAEPTQASPGGVPIPYPDPPPPPVPECPASLCPKAGATLELGGQTIEVRRWSWGKQMGAGPVYSADPQEGGQIVRRKAGGDQIRNSGTVYSADPQEGGQVTARKAGGDQIRTSGTVYSADPQEGGQFTGRKAGGGQDEGGKPFRNVQLAEPLASGTVTVVVARGMAATGQHIPEVKLSARGRTYQLQDVQVAACTPAGGGNDSCTLTYASMSE